MEQRDLGPGPAEGTGPGSDADDTPPSVPDTAGDAAGEAPEQAPGSAESSRAVEPAAVADKAESLSDDAARPVDAPQPESPDLAATTVIGESPRLAAALPSEPPAENPDLTSTVVAEVSRPASESASEAADEAPSQAGQAPNETTPEAAAEAAPEADHGPASPPEAPAPAPAGNPDLDATIVRAPFEGQRPRSQPSGPPIPPIPTPWSAPPNQSNQSIQSMPSMSSGPPTPPTHTTTSFAEPSPRRPGPKRWVLVAASVLAAVALATAATLAARGASDRSPGAAGVMTDATGTTTTSGTPSATPTGSTSSATSDAATTDSSAATSSKQSATTGSSTPTPSQPPATSRSVPPPSPSAGDETDCESASHSTPADVAANLTGMTRSAQKAFTEAQADAKAAGLTFVLNSGYRSAAYQQRVYDCWVRHFGGSTQAARQYALPPNESAHVKGYAMDIAPQNAAAWLEATAGKYGLCRRYADEPWHFEYQSSYRLHGCPSLLPQP